MANEGNSSKAKRAALRRYVINSLAARLWTTPRDRLSLACAELTQPGDHLGDILSRAYGSEEALVKGWRRLVAAVAREQLK